MFEFRPNYPERIKEKTKKRTELIKQISQAKTLQKLREALLLALEEGDL